MNVWVLREDAGSTCEKVIIATLASVENREARVVFLLADAGMVKQRGCF